MEQAITDFLRNKIRLSSLPKSKLVRILYWSGKGVRRESKFDICSIEGYELNILTLDSRYLNQPIKHGSLVPVDVDEDQAWDFVYFHEVDERANILYCLYLAKKVIKPNGEIKINFASKTNLAPSEIRIIHWKEYWNSIAQRLGLESIDYIDDVMYLRLADKQPRWELKLADKNDISNIFELFEVSFNSRLPYKLWSWKYAKGHGFAVLAYRNGELVAHYGSIFREIAIGHDSIWAMQPCDVMVHPNERGILTRNGVFLNIGATWSELYGPPSFGFPSNRHFRIGEKNGGYSSAGKVFELRWQLRDYIATSHSLTIYSIHSSSPIKRDIDSLWLRMQADLFDSVVGVRDWAWIKYRYLEHPTLMYSVLAVREPISGLLVGVFVLRLIGDQVELLDVIASLIWMPQIIDAACIAAKELCAKSMFTWITENHINEMSHASPQLSETEIIIPGDAWTGSFDLARYVDSWWLTSGDTDFH